MMLAVITELTTLGCLETLATKEEWDYPTLQEGDVVMLRPDLWHLARLDARNRCAVMVGGGRIGWLYRDEVMPLESGSEDNETQEEDNGEVHQASSHVRGQERSQASLRGSDPAADR